MGWKSPEKHKEYNQQYYLKNRERILLSLKTKYFKTKKPCLICKKLISEKSKHCIPCVLKKRNQTIIQRMAVSRAKKGKLGKKWTDEQKKRASLQRRGIPKPNTKEYKQKQSDAHKGKKAYWYGKRGIETPSWRGGKTPELNRLRSTFEYKEWRRKVYKRDNYTCQKCEDSRGGNLEADHIKPFAIYPKLRFNVSNGVTLCRKCHRQTPTWGMNGKKMIYDVATNGRKNPKIIDAVKNVD